MRILVEIYTNYDIDTDIVTREVQWKASIMFNVQAPLWLQFVFLLLYNNFGVFILF